MSKEDTHHGMQMSVSLYMRTTTLERSIRLSPNWIHNNIFTTHRCGSETDNIDLRFLMPSPQS